MTRLRRPDQRGVTMYRKDPDGRLWVKPLQAECPAKGYFMNTMRSGAGIGSWFRPRIAPRDIPKRLMTLLSGTDNRRNLSDEVEGAAIPCARVYATAARTHG